MLTHGSCTLQPETLENNYLEIPKLSSMYVCVCENIREKISFSTEDQSQGLGMQNRFVHHCGKRASLTITFYFFLLRK